MDLDKFDKMIDVVLSDLSKYNGEIVTNNGVLEAEVKNILTVASSTLKEHETFFKNILTEIKTDDNQFYRDARSFSKVEAIYVLKHIKEIVEIEGVSIEKTDELKLFESANDKIKQAGLAFKENDYPSVFHSINTALEMVLKDKLGIPSTIIGINTSNIIEVLVKYKVEPYLYLSEAKKHVVLIDNKVKHEGYLPTKVDSISALKTMEELLSKLKDKEVNLTDEIRNKIYERL